MFYPRQPFCLDGNLDLISSRSLLVPVVPDAQTSAFPGYKLQLAGRRSKIMANSTILMFEEIRTRQSLGLGVNRGHYFRCTGSEDGRPSSIMGRALASKAEKPRKCRIRITSSDSRNSCRCWPCAQAREGRTRRGRQVGVEV